MQVFDLHTKAMDGSQQRTLTGAVVTIVSGVIMVLLFLSELRAYTSTEVKNRLYVDASRGKNQIRINLNISFPALQCNEVHLDLEDSKGQRLVNMDQRKTLHKTPLLASGHLEPSLIGGGGGGGGGGVGCNLEGSVMVNKVAGNFHVTLGRNSIANNHLRYTFSLEEAARFNSSHRIHHLSFGDRFPGMVNSLDGTEMVNLPRGKEQAQASHERRDGRFGHMPFVNIEACQFKYHLSVVPSVYLHLDGRRIASNQFAHTAHTLPVDLAHGKFVHPGVYFKYDFHPLVVERTELRPGFLSFLTRLCAILGGTFTVAGMVTTGIGTVTATVVASDKDG